MSPSVRRIKNLLSSSSSQKKLTKNDKSSKSGKRERRPESEEREALSFMDWDSTADLGRLPHGQEGNVVPPCDYPPLSVARRGVELGSDIEEITEDEGDGDDGDDGDNEDEDEDEDAAEEDGNEELPGTPTFNLAETERLAERQRMAAKAFGGLPSSSSMRKSRARYRSGSGTSTVGHSTGASTASLPRPGTPGSLSRTVTPGCHQRPTTPGSIPRSATPGSLTRTVTAGSLQRPVTPGSPHTPPNIEESMMPTSGVRRGHMRSGRKPPRLKISEDQPSSSGQRVQIYRTPYGLVEPGRRTPTPTARERPVVTSEIMEQSLSPENLRKRRLRGIMANSLSVDDETTWSANEDPFELSLLDPNKKILPDGTEGSSISRPSFEAGPPPSEKELQCYETLRETFAHSIALQRTAVPLLGIANGENVPSEMRELISQEAREGLYNALKTAQDLQERIKRLALYTKFDEKGNNIEARAKHDVDRTGGDPEQIGERVRDWMNFDEVEGVQQIDLNSLWDD